MRIAERGDYAASSRERPGDHDFSSVFAGSDVEAALAIMTEIQIDHRGPMSDWESLDRAWRKVPKLNASVFCLAEFS
jgi:hypothetical protein